MTTEYRFVPRRRVRPLIWRTSEWPAVPVPAIPLAALKPKEPSMRHAFTVIEFMVILAIIGIIVVLLILGCGAARAGATAATAEAEKTTHRFSEERADGLKNAWVIRDSLSGKSYICVVLSSGVSMVEIESAPAEAQ